MLGIDRITTALVNAINTHQETAVTGVVGVIGTAVGAVLTALFDWLKHRGNLKVAPVTTQLCYLGPDASGAMRDIGSATDARNLRYSFTLRLLNTYPKPKSIALESVEFYRKRRFWWLLSDPLLRSRPATFSADPTKATVEDLTVPAHAFLTVFVRGLAIDADQQGLEARGRLKEAKVARVTLIAAPKKRLIQWYSF